jgi:tetratricopeptide (TPR) repeat protein
MKMKHLAYFASIALVCSSLLQTAHSADVLFPMNDLGLYDVSQVDLLNQGNAFMHNHEYAKARQTYDSVIAHDAKCWIAFFGRAEAFEGLHEWGHAVADYDMTIRLKPSFYMASIQRASVNARLGNYNAAFSEYEHLLSLHPMAYTRALILNDRAWLRATAGNATIRNGHEAISDAKAACNLTTWSKPEYIDTLAAAYAEAGDFQSATQFEERALKDVHDVTRKGYEQRLSLFQSHRPFRYASR